MKRWMIVAALLVAATASAKPVDLEGAEGAAIAALIRSKGYVCDDVAKVIGKGTEAKGAHMLVACAPGYIRYDVYLLRLPSGERHDTVEPR